MNIITRLMNLLGDPPGHRPLRTDPSPSRSYVVGPSLVERADIAWGHDNAEFSDPDYLSYIATSNNVYACVNKRATAMASLPLTLYRGKNKDTRKAVEKGALRNLLDSVNPWMTFDSLMHLTEQHLCLMGEAFWFLERGTGGRRPPTEIWPVRPDYVRIVPDERDFIKGFLLHPPDGSSPISYLPDEVIWFPLPNPIDPYSGLAPLAAARLAADVASAAMKSNRAIFANGSQIGGVISPADNAGVITPEQAKQLQEDFKRNFKGPANAHRMAILDYAVKFQQWTMTPKDAEFVGALNLTLEEIARAFGIIPELLGAGNRTFQNAPEARYAFWADTITSEARFVARQVTERLLPMFPGEADVAEFDFSEVDALKENEDSIEQRWAAWIADGRKTRNEWRAEQGDPPVPWGDDAWLPAGLVPVGGPMAAQAEKAAQEAQDKADEQAKQIAQGQNPAQEQTPNPDDSPADQAGNDAGDRGRSRARRMARAIEYGSAEHERIMTRVAQHAEPHERRVGNASATLMRNQRKSVLAKLNQHTIPAAIDDPERAAEALVDQIMNQAHWIREFRMGMKPVLRDIIDQIGANALEGIGLTGAFDVDHPEVRRALMRQLQRFAVEVNQTTWDDLKASLSEGLKAAEGIDALAKRVQEVMGSRIRSSAETIARTEVTAATTIGDREGWRQSGVVSGRTWIAAFDSRTRDTHADAHGQTVGLDEDFTVGGVKGAGPGMMGSAKESANCRCTTVAVLDTDEPKRLLSGGGKVSPNGHHTAPLVALARVMGVEA